MTSNKKANVVIDIIMFIIVLSVFALISIFGWKAWSDLEPDIRLDATTNQSTETIDQVETRYPSMIDGLFMLMFLGMWIVGSVSAYMSDSHPMLFGIMLVLVVFVIIAGVMLGNFYEELFTDSTLTTLTNDFPATHWIMTHMLMIGIVIATSMTLIYSAKGRG